MEGYGRRGRDGGVPVRVEGYGLGMAGMTGRSDHTAAIEKTCAQLPEAAHICSSSTAIARARNLRSNYQASDIYEQTS